MCCFICVCCGKVLELLHLPVRLVGALVISLLTFFRPHPSTRLSRRHTNSAGISGALDVIADEAMEGEGCDDEEVTSAMAGGGGGVGGAGPRAANGGGGPAWWTAAAAHEGENGTQ